VRQMKGGADAHIEDDVLMAQWRAGEKRLQVLANLSGTAKPRPALGWGTPIWGDQPPQDLPAWSVFAAVGGV